MINDTIECNICNKTPAYVCNGMGPMSIAMCKECLALDIVPYWNMLAYLFTLEPRTIDDLSEWCHSTVNNTLKYYNKSFADFAIDCRNAMKNYEEEMKKII